MAGKKTTGTDGESHDELEKLVHEAMLRLGWLFPETPEDIARIEAELESSGSNLPPELRDPYTVFDAEKCARPNYVAKPSSDQDEDDMADCLGRAAREGKVIRPEVEERMHRDRELAERGTDDRG